MLSRSTISSVLLSAIAAAAQPAWADATPPSASATSSIDATAREQSRAAFRRGVEQLRAEDWAAARASFEEAWELVQHPSILLNLGIARLHTDDPVLAEQDLLRFLSEDPGAAAEEVASARDALAEARKRIGTLRIIATPASARVLVDGKPLAVRAVKADDGEQSIAETRLKIGSHSVAVEAQGFDASTQSVDVASTGETEIRVPLVARTAPQVAPAGPSTRKIVGWSLAGTAGVAMAASGLMALRALSLSGDYADRGSVSFQSQDVKDEGIAFRTGADVALAVGLVAGAGAVILLFTDIGASRPAGAARIDRPFGVRW